MQKHLARKNLETNRAQRFAELLNSIISKLASVSCTRLQLCATVKGKPPTQLASSQIWCCNSVLVAKVTVRAHLARLELENGRILISCRKVELY